MKRVLVICALLCCCTGGYAMKSGDAYVRREGSKWAFGTASVRRVVSLEDAKLLLKSFRAGASGRELVPPGAEAEEFAVSVGQGAAPVTSASGGWVLADAHETKLKQGELQLDIALEREGLRVTKSYVVYPRSSIIREWVTFTNAGAAPLPVADPRFLNLTVAGGDPAALDFHWMTGGENNPGSWVLKSERLAPEKPRTFDSYEAMPVDTSLFPGDGTNAKILLNDRQIWPSEGWQYVPNATVTVPFAVTADVAAGDKLVFLVNMHGNIGWDTTAFDPTIAYDDGETHVASREFAAEQGRSGWRYQYLENGKLVDLVYYPEPKQWRKARDNATGTPFVGAGDQHPDVGQDAARVWTAPKGGRVRISGSVCNTGNGVNASHGFRMGSSTYAPWVSLYHRDTQEGLFIGWDYFGHWGSSYTLLPAGAVKAELHVAGYHRTLAPGESVTTPKAFVGLYREDLDNAGNECLDWQYRYLWDYTREQDGWFPAIRMLGYWMRGTGWGQPGVSWTGGNPDLESTFRKVFRVADLMRWVGADVYHRDWGWWDRAGDWNGPDFRATGEYLRKSGIGQLIYGFLYTVDAQSKVAREHPDWVLGGGTLDLSRPEVVACLKGQLDDFVERWGDFEWRNDSTPTCPRDGDDTPLLGQDQGLREVIRGFLDKHPRCAFQAVNGGGNNAGYDYARYASTVSFSDGAVGIIRNYWASLLLPPDKTSDIPDIWNPDRYDKATWRGLLCINFDMTGDTVDRARLEGVRELIDIYHYLHKHGVVGRWVRVYRPLVEGDDPTMYFQRLSGDARRGIIIPKRPAAGVVTIRPKGLLPGEEYVVTFQESDATQKRRGDDLMARGITLEEVPAGELVYLNLPGHPGSKLDTTPPTPPSAVAKRRARHMGYPGVEIAWKPGTDDNWVSYYEVFRDGVLLEKVAKGSFTFDHSAGADQAAEYTVRTVDGAGNVSTAVAARGPAAARAHVIDDGADGIRFEGEWKRANGQWPAHGGSLTSSQTKGAKATVTFEGRRVLLFARLGPDCGRAAVSIDGGPAEAIDTFSADDIWGACVYEKDLATGGRHTLSLAVLGERGPLAKDAFIRVDGVRVEGE